MQPGTAVSWRVLARVGAFPVPESTGEQQDGMGGLAPLPAVPDWEGQNRPTFPRTGGPGHSWALASHSMLVMQTQAEVQKGHGAAQSWG